MQKCLSPLLALGLCIASLDARASQVDMFDVPADLPPPANSTWLLVDASYTYARCWYADSNEHHHVPLTGYVWARDERGDWLKVRGHWWSSSPLAWRNMFYTSTTVSELREICERTLRANGVASPLLDVYAADNRFSLNHTFWSETAAPGNKVDRLIVFGDSLSDTSNVFNASQWNFPHPSSWMFGRFSNGKVWVEYLAQELDLPLYSWAVGGSAGQSYIVLPGLGEQIDSWASYMDRAKHFDPARARYVFFIGANDIINYGRPVADTARILKEAMMRVIARGGRDIVVLNLPDVSRAPAVRDSPDKFKIASQVIVYNELLYKAVQELRASTDAAITMVNTYELFNQFLDAPADYGIYNTTQPCLDIARDSFLNYLSAQKRRAECTDPDAYLFWDMTHPTTHTHRIVARKVAEELRMTQQ